MTPYPDMPPTSRLWVYQSSRRFTDEEVNQLEKMLLAFVAEWKAHGHQLRTSALIRYHRFIILLVDESQAGASGCSIDASVRFLQQIEKDFDTQLFDRLAVAYKAGEEVEVVPQQTFKAMLADGRLHENTVVFNNLVQTKAALEKAWEVPVKESWHKRFLSAKTPA